MHRSKLFFRWLTAWLLLCMLGVGLLGGAGLSARAAPQVKPLAICPDPTIAQWTFDGITTFPGYPILANTGIGSLQASPTLPNPTFPTSFFTNPPAISFTGWPNTLNSTFYIEFQISTLGMSAITLTLASSRSNTGPNSFDIQYSTDGLNFILLQSAQTVNTNDTNYSFDFSSSPDLNNKPNVSFRLYGYGGSGGTWRLDDVTFSGVCPPAPLTIIINEVAWAGTAANTDHEWIELYNPGTAPVDITGWSLQAVDGNPNIPLSGTIPPGGYFLLERNEDAVADIAANIVFAFSNTLANSGETLILYDDTSNVIDVANSNGGTWPAGSSSLHATMERIGDLPDSDDSWFTNNGVMKNGVDADGNPIFGTPKGLNSLTPTITPIATLTPTVTFTPTITTTPPPGNVRSIVINEVAWAGTRASADDEWIELYNPGTAAINLAGWVLKSSDGSPTIELPNVNLAANGYFLLERTDDNTVADITADQIYTGSLTNSGEILYLYDPADRIIDTANSTLPIFWPAGNPSDYSSMQRSVIAADSNFVWVTYDVTKDLPANYAHDAAGDPIRGTPRRANLPINVTATPTRVSTTTGGSSGGSTGGIATPAPVIGISEFLPRPGYDWNNDGKVDVFDEFIEIINAGRGDINLSAYRLDDEQIGGSVPYTLPNLVLKPDERAVFYASESGILLSDAGDTVRLLRGNTVIDAYTYPVVRYPDQSWCRIPDRLGYWNDPCFPTPNNANALTGRIPLPSGGPTGYRPPVCLLPDTAPDEFIYAECEIGGDGIWNRQFWDEADAARLLILGEAHKWVTFFE